MPGLGVDLGVAVAPEGRGRRVVRRVAAPRDEGEAPRNYMKGPGGTSAFAGLRRLLQS